MDFTLGQVEGNFNKNLITPYQTSITNCEDENKIDKFADFSEKERILFNETKIDSKYIKTGQVIKKGKRLKKEIKSDSTMRQEVFRIFYYLKKMIFLF